ncbi:hypothetical protein [Nocardioides lijunqiniae]|uniref:hypothetical protein n=1 Tax=Nocardioides lijunqiniae TaxID=2760832 RepID=UPI001878F035|nr:hypothetical protein [Nocardioides lijunqiniae]
MTIDFTSKAGQVRLLLNDIDEGDFVFEDEEIAAFLLIEGDHVKLAAAQAIDTNASNEALASKVLKDHQLSTDGAKLADALRKHAAALREQHQAAVDDADEGYFDVIDILGADCRPERTQYPYC